ncbi:MAG: hypothetical protein RLZZ606_435 [Actinomycetota bacterium]|jgi:hypothetical protein
MATKKMTERLALPMFVCGIIAMVSSAGVSLGASANATSPIEYEKVTMTYLSSGFSASDSNCGSTQDVYYGSSRYSSFRSKNMRNSGNDQTFLCTASFYVVTNVDIPTPKPVPTMTVIYSPEPSAKPRPTKTVYVTPSAKPRPTKSPKPSPSATQSPRPKPSYFISPSPRPKPSLYIPTPAPTKSPRG